MSIAGITGAMLLASTPVSGIVSPPSNSVDLVASTTNVQETSQLKALDGTSETLGATPVSDEPTALADPTISSVPTEAIETDPSILKATEIPDPVSGVETGETLQDENVITVTGRIRTPGDPLQNINAESYAITQAIDEAVVEPSAHAYEKSVPEPVRNGLRNFANNLHEPAVFVNFLLQLKPGKAAETAGRFLVNSTAGVAGLFDFAKRKPINLPRRKNGFADTLGCYGVKPGPFLFLPVIGATTVRDLIGGGVDAFAIPIPVPNSAGRTLSQPYVAVPSSVARELDKRVEFDEELEIIHNSDDPYVASREYYLQKRQTQIAGLCGTKKNTSDLK